MLARTGAPQRVALRRAGTVRVERRLPTAVSQTESQRQRWDYHNKPVSHLIVAPLFAHKLIHAVFFGGFWHFAGVTSLLELPKNCVAGAMDKEISKKMRTRNKQMNVWVNIQSSDQPCPLFCFVVIYRLTVSTDSSISVAEIRCLSDHQDQIRSLINVNGESVSQ